MRRKKTLLFYTLALLVILLFTYLNFRKFWKSAFYSGPKNELPRQSGLAPSNGCMPSESSQELDGILRQAYEISHRHPPLLLGIINDAYIPMTFSWLCNVKNMSVFDQLLFVAVDDSSYEQMRNRWPEIRVKRMHFLENFQGHQTYSRVGYVKLMLRRTELINCLIMAGVEMILIETDWVWFRNPSQTCTRYTDVDIVGTVVNMTPTQMSGAILYLRPTNNTKRLWMELTKRMRDLDRKSLTGNYKNAVSEDNNDQTYLNVLLHHPCCRCRYKILPFSLAPSGKWYQMNEKTRRKYHPEILHNNWIAGNLAKIKRAQRFGHWFLAEDMKCNETSLRMALQRNR